jgi:hypothetical protein
MQISVLWGDIKTDKNDQEYIQRIEDFVIQFWLYCRSVGLLMGFFTHFLLNMDLYRIVRDPFKPQSARLKGYWIAAIVYFIIVSIVHYWLPLNSPPYIYTALVITIAQYFSMIYFLYNSIITLRK